MRYTAITVLVTSMLTVGGAAIAATAPSSATPESLPGGLSYPVCDRTHRDQCLQLGQNVAMDRQLYQAFPQCQKLKGNKEERAACINSAGAVANQ
jgi:hypothetical protein